MGVLRGARTQHRYQTCRDEGCERFACRSTTRATGTALALWVGSLHLRPFGRCSKCSGTGHVKSGKRRVKVCPALQGQLPATPSRTATGIPDGTHTHGSGGSGLGTAVLVLMGAALAVKLAAPAAAAVGELVHILMAVAAQSLPEPQRSAAALPPPAVHVHHHWKS